MSQPPHDLSFYNGAPGIVSGPTLQQGDSTSHQGLPSAVPQPEQQRKRVQGFAFGVVAPNGVLDTYAPQKTYQFRSPVDADGVIIHVEDPLRGTSRTYPLGSKLFVVSDLHKFAKSRNAEFLQWLSTNGSETGVSRHLPDAGVPTQARLRSEQESTPSQASDRLQPPSAQHTDASVLPGRGNEGRLKRSAAEADLDAVDPSADVEERGDHSSIAAVAAPDSTASVPKRAKHSSLTKDGSRTGVPGKRQYYRHHKFPETSLPQGISAFDIVDHHPDHLKGQVLDKIITSGDMSAGDIAERLTQNGHASDRTNVYNKWKAYWKTAYPDATAADFEQARKAARAAYQTQAKIDLRERHRRPDSQAGPALAALAHGQAVSAPSPASHDSVFRDRDENGELDGNQEINDSTGTLSGYHPSDQEESEDSASTNPVQVGFGSGSGTRRLRGGNPNITGGEFVPHKSYITSNVPAYPPGPSYAPISSAPPSHAPPTYTPAAYGSTNDGPPTHAPASHTTASGAGSSSNAFRPNSPFVQPGPLDSCFTSVSYPAGRSPEVAFTSLDTMTRFGQEPYHDSDDSAFGNGEFADLDLLAAFAAHEATLVAQHGALPPSGSEVEAFGDYSTDQAENGQDEEEQGR